MRRSVLTGCDGGCSRWSGTAVAAANSSIDGAVAASAISPASVVSAVFVVVVMARSAKSAVAVARGSWEVVAVGTEAEPIFLRLPFIADTAERREQLYQRFWQANLGAGPTR